MNKIKLTTKKMKQIQKFREVIKEIEFESLKKKIKIEFKNQEMLADDIEQQLELTFETNFDFELLKSLFKEKKYKFELLKR